MLLDPNSNPAANAYQQAIFAQGIPATAFEDDLASEHVRLEHLGVRFTMPPTRMGPVMQAACDDTCGNLIQLYELSSPP